MQKLICILFIGLTSVAFAEKAPNIHKWHFNGLNFQFSPISHLTHSGHWNDDFYLKLGTESPFTSGRINDFKNKNVAYQMVTIPNTWAYGQNADINFSFKYDCINKWPGINKEIRIGLKIMSLNIPPVYMQWNTGETMMGVRRGTFGIQSVTSMLHFDFLLNKLVSNRFALYGGAGIEVGKSFKTTYLLFDTAKLAQFEPNNYYETGYKEPVNPFHLVGGKIIGGFKINVSCNVNLYAEADFSYFTAKNKAAQFNYGILNFWSGIRVKFNKPINGMNDEPESRANKKIIKWGW